MSKMNKEELNKKLLDAAGKGDLEGVKKALKAGADVATVTVNRQTALMRAASSGNLKLVKYLAEEGGAGADIDVPDDSYWTALMWAACKGNLEIVKYLLGKWGASVAIEGFTYGQDEVRWSVLKCAIASGNIKLVKYLKDKGAR
ncbi:ankyrin repeat domain-containing protein [Candidatus Micrarchaeota archaeon]|nr:ankyrin repeat domain-containing protein [Candidatus Micrarchaeota archaeon]